MYGATGTVGLLSRISDPRRRESVREERRRTLRRILFGLGYGWCQPFETVSNNLGVYFLFCLFRSAILALFLWSSMQALQTSLFFFVLRRQVWQVFMYQSSFIGGVLWISSDRDSRMGAKINTLKNPGTKV